MKIDINLFAANECQPRGDYRAINGNFLRGKKIYLSNVREIDINFLQQMNANHEVTIVLLMVTFCVEKIYLSNVS